MRLLDTNVIVHAVYKGSPLHLPAAAILARALDQKGQFCITPQNIVEFLSVVTRGRFVDPPLDAGDAARIANTLFKSRRLRKIYPARGTVLRAAKEGQRIGVKGTAWYDLYLAATMRDNNVETIVTENIRDFRSLDFVSPIRIEEAL
jgi:predicted nucleic acid-binding protein